MSLNGFTIFKIDKIEVQLNMSYWQRTFDWLIRNQWKYRIANRSDSRYFPKIWGEGETSVWLPSNELNINEGGCIAMSSNWGHTRFKWELCDMKIRRGKYLLISRCICVHIWCASMSALYTSIEKLTFVSNTNIRYLFFLTPISCRPVVLITPPTATCFYMGHQDETFPLKLMLLPRRFPIMRYRSLFHPFIPVVYFYHTTAPLWKPRRPFHTIIESHLWSSWNSVAGTRSLTFHCVSISARTWCVGQYFVNINTDVQSIHSSHSNLPFLKKFYFRIGLISSCLLLNLNAGQK